MKVLKKYWVEILIFSLLFGVMLIDLAPNLTWMMVDSDGPEYVMDAKYFYPAHHTSAPLYLLTGHLFLQIPYGSDYWRMSLMSALFTLGVMVFVYLIVRQMIAGNRGRYYGLLASVIFGGSALVFAQAIIVETYAMITFFSVGAYYFTLKKNWVMVSVMLGLGLVTHHLILLTWLVLILAHRELRNWKRIGITVCFLVFYLYMPLSVRFTDQPNMWGNTSVMDFISNNVNVFGMLVGKLSIWDLPKRILDTLGILGISFGLTLVAIGVWMAKTKRVLKTELFWLFLLPILYFMGDLAYQTAKYMEASIAWGAIMAVVGLSQIKVNWGKVLNVVVCVSAVAVLGISVYKFDIGNHLDPNLSATEFYKQGLPKMKSGDVFVTMGAWEWILVFLYNKEHGTNIIPVCMGILPNAKYRQVLRDKGVKLTELDFSAIAEISKSNLMNHEQVDYALEIIRDNPMVWTSRPTTPETYGAEIVPAVGNEGQITKWLGSDIVNPQLHWKPSNPYDIITGSIEVAEWNFILQSNKNCLMLLVAGLTGYYVVALLYRVQNRRRKGVSGVQSTSDIQKKETTIHQ